MLVALLLATRFGNVKAAGDTYNYDVSRPSLRIGQGYISASNSTIILDVTLAVYHSNGVNMMVTEVGNSGTSQVKAKYTCSVSRWVTAVNGTFGYGSNTFYLNRTYPG